MTRWYAVYTQSGMELWARSNLWERGYQVYLPRHLKRRRHARRIDWVPRPLFSRYLFVRTDLQRGGGARGIDYAPGVVRLLRMGQRPSAVPDEIIAEIQGRENADGFVTLSEDALRRGQPVRIVASALCDQAGLFDRMTDNQRVVVFINLLGRFVRVHLDAESVAADV